MPDARHNLFIPVRGDLDTADNVGDRPIGTLVEAKDVSSRFWGPRPGSQAFTRVWEGPGTASLYDAIWLGGGSHGYHRSYENQFRDLGLKFTIDVWFRLDEIAYASAVDEIGLYDFNVGARGDVSIGIHGGTQGGNATKIRVSIVTTPSRTTAASADVFTSTNTISYGTAQKNKHHIRLVRDGTTATLYVDGVQEGQTTSLANDPINAQQGDAAIVRTGRAFNSDVDIKGAVFASILRDGAYTSDPIEAVLPCAPWASNVHHYILGRSIDLGGGEYHYFDAGRFAAHGRVLDAGGGEGVDYTVTSSNDDTAPAPAVVQGISSWTTRTNRTATSVLAGGVLTTSTVT